MVKEKGRHFFMLALSTLILMIPSLYNGYPLVYTDTGTYIQSGMALSIPLDRPAMYGLFIRFASLHTSLWLVLLVQCFIVCWVLELSFRLFTNTMPASKKYIFSMAVLVAFTGIGWYAGQLMPDIFTPLAILCVLLLLFYKRFSYLQRFLLALILVFSENVHFSNFAICILVFLVVFFSLRIKAFAIQLKEIRFLFCGLVIVAGMLISALTNYALGGALKITQGSHVFLTARMLDTGILKKFLDEKCDDGKFTLCAYKDSLPEDSRAFLWGEKSPLAKTGGWKGSQRYYDYMLGELFKSPKYMSLFLYHGVISGFSQLLQNEIGSGLVSTYYEVPESPCYTQIAMHFPNELNAYRQSRQNGNLWEQRLDFTWINALFYILLIACVLFLLIVVFSGSLWRSLPDQLKLLCVAIVSGCVINAFVTGVLANVYDRLQGRVSWMFVYLVLVIIISEPNLFRDWLKRKINY